MCGSEVCECLLAWIAGVQEFLNSTRYRTWADDLAQEFVLQLIVDERNGKAIPPWPGTLSDQMRRRVLQMAKKMNGLVLEPFKDRAQNDLIREEEPRPRTIALNKKFERLKSEFTIRQIQQMLKQTCAASFTQRMLAEAARISYRTLKYKFHKLRS